MEMMPVSSERKAQLEEYAHRHGQEPVATLDEAGKLPRMGAPGLQRNRECRASGLRGGEGGTYAPASEFLEQLRKKHGLPR